MRKKQLPLLGLLTILVALVLMGCAGMPGVSTPYPNDVDWETAVEILNSGDVEMVVQLHSLDVTLTLKDGTEINTVEPSIDAIFREVDKCGQPCREIILATE
jgi:hypothetical protein